MQLREAIDKLLLLYLYHELLESEGNIRILPAFQGVVLQSHVEGQSYMSYMCYMAFQSYFQSLTFGSFQTDSKIA